ncbi:hypothetical protein U9M48_019267 [Paspalum notatum var. saurae]|uniref:Uncharacterized protein n=1 Tax=Paspalum notatum var. saurae TaxID=547442 RepID=A0AAQ3WQK9_PASNO
MTDLQPALASADHHLPAAGAKLSEDVGTPVVDPTDYRSLAGALHLLRYLKGSVDYGYFSTGLPPLTSSSTPTLIGLGVRTLAGPRPTTLPSWAATLSPSRPSDSRLSRAPVLRPSTGLSPTAWRGLRLRRLLAELHGPLTKSTLVYRDKVSAVYLSTNPVQHQWTKHVEIDLHFVRDRVAIGDVRVLHVPTTSQFADIFTKGLPSATFSEFRSSLNITSG